MSCSNDVKCSPSVASYISNFTFSQNDGDPWNPASLNERDNLIQQEQHVAISSCAKFTLLSNGTKEGTRVNGGSMADTNKCPKVQKMPSPTAGAKKTTSIARPAIGATIKPQPEQVNTSRGSRRTTLSSLWFVTFLVSLIVLFPGSRASAIHGHHQELRIRAKLRVRDVSDKVRAFAESFSIDLAEKANAVGQNGEVFAHNLVADVISSLCDGYFSGQDLSDFAPSVLEGCAKSVYGGERLPQAAGQFFAVFGASLLCDYVISEAYPVAGEFFPDGCEGLQDLARKTSPKITVGLLSQVMDVPSPTTDVTTSPLSTESQATIAIQSNASLHNTLSAEMSAPNIASSNDQILYTPTPDILKSGVIPITAPDSDQVSRPEDSRSYTQTFISSAALPFKNGVPISFDRVSAAAVSIDTQAVLPSSPTIAPVLSRSLASFRSFGILSASLAPTSQSLNSGSTIASPELSAVTVPSETAKKISRTSSPGVPVPPIVVPNGNTISTIQPPQSDILATMPSIMPSSTIAKSAFRSPDLSNLASVISSILSPPSVDAFIFISSGTTIRSSGSPVVVSLSLVPSPESQITPIVPVATPPMIKSSSGSQSTSHSPVENILISSAQPGEPTRSLSGTPTVESVPLQTPLTGSSMIDEKFPPKVFPPSFLNTGALLSASQPGHSASSIPLPSLEMLSFGFPSIVQSSTTLLSSTSPVVSLPLVTNSITSLPMDLPTLVSNSNIVPLETPSLSGRSSGVSFSIPIPQLTPDMSSSPGVTSAPVSNTATLPPPITSSTIFNSTPSLIVDDSLSTWKSPVPSPMVSAVSVNSPTTPSANVNPIPVFSSTTSLLNTTPTILTDPPTPIPDTSTSPMDSPSFPPPVVTALTDSSSTALSSMPGSTELSTSTTLPPPFTSSTSTDSSATTTSPLVSDSTNPTPITDLPSASQPSTSTSLPTTCSAPLLFLCPGIGCVNLSANNAHCGTCFHPCIYSCYAGVCRCPDSSLADENGNCNGTAAVKDIVSTTNMESLDSCPREFSPSGGFCCHNGSRVFEDPDVGYNGDDCVCADGRAFMSVEECGLAGVTTTGVGFPSATLSSLIPTSFAVQPPSTASPLSALTSCPSKTPVLCGATCVNTQSSSFHCGSCNRGCRGRCVDGVCVPDDGQLPKSSRQTLTSTMVLASTSTQGNTGPTGYAQFIWIGLGGT